MELREYVDIVRRRVTWVVIPILLAVVAAAFFVFTASPKFSSTTTLFFLDDASASSSSPDADRLVSYATLVTSARIATSVRQKLQLKMSLDELQKSITASARPSTLLLDVTATASTRRDAEAIASAAAEDIIGLAADLEASRSSAAGSRAPARLTIAQEAAPAKRVGGHVQDLVLAAMLGLLAGVGLALVREALDRRVNSVAQIRNDTGAPTLARVPALRRDSAVPSIVGDPSSRPAEAFRRLRLSLQLGRATAPATVVIAGCEPGDGATTTVCGLGETLEQAGMHVVLVGVDPLSTDDREGTPREGLAEVLLEKMTLADGLVPWRDGGRMQVLPRGRIDPHWHELFGTEAMAWLAHSLEQRFDVVLVKAPPLRSSVDAAIFAAAIRSGLVIVVRHGKTQREHVRDAVEVVHDGGAKLLGIVLTSAPRRFRSRPSGTRVRDSGHEVPTKPSAAAG